MELPGATGGTRKPSSTRRNAFKSNLSSIVRCLNESKESFDIFLSDGRILKGRMEKQANKNLEGIIGSCIP
jgi:hypothetical protein